MEILTDEGRVRYKPKPESSDPGEIEIRDLRADFALEVDQIRVGIGFTWDDEQRRFSSHVPAGEHFTVPPGYPVVTIEAQFEGGLSGTEWIVGPSVVEQGEEALPEALFDGAKDMVERAMLDLSAAVEMQRMAEMLNGGEEVHREWPENWATVLKMRGDTEGFGP